MKKIFLILTVMATLVSCGGNSTDATAPATDAGSGTIEATSEATSNATTSDSTSVEATSKVEKK
jgi:hypothetical protein